jgi:hypothetical protein
MKTYFLLLLEIRIECLIANYFLSRGSPRKIRAVKRGTGADCCLKKISLPLSVKFLINNFLIKRTRERSLGILKKTVLSLKDENWDSVTEHSF